MAEAINKTLDGCFHSKEGKPNLRRIAPDTRRAKEHIEKAHSNLRAMRLMFNHDLFDWTIVCGYYAMYHAVLASLFKIGIRATAHYCALAAFEKFYVYRGRVKPEYVKYIRRAKQLEEKYADTLEEAKENRVIVQYGVQILTNDDAEWIIEDAEDFVLKIEEILAE